MRMQPSHLAPRVRTIGFFLVLAVLAGLVDVTALVRLVRAMVEEHHAHNENIRNQAIDETRSDIRVKSYQTKSVLLRPASSISLCLLATNPSFSGILAA